MFVFHIAWFFSQKFPTNIVIFDKFIECHRELFKYVLIVYHRALVLTLLFGNLEKIEINIPARVVWIGTQTMWIESKTLAEVGDSIRIKGAFAERLGLKEINAQVVEKQKSHLSYRFSDDELFFEYRMVIRTNNQDNLARLAAALRQLPTVRAFRISPTGD